MQPWTHIYTHTHNVQKHQVPTSVEYTNHKIYSSYSKTSPPCLLVRPQIMLFCKLPTHVTQCVVPHDSRGTRPGFPPSASSHLAALIPSPCVSAPFPVRLACLANLPLCLYVNLTSWQAYWSASKMTWLAGGSILLFGSWHPQVLFKWAATAWFRQRCPCEAAQSASMSGMQVWLQVRV